ncbi:MAG: hypothetical protein Q9192_007480, partial [Flavoplaca navasiana]
PGPTRRESCTLTNVPIDSSVTPYQESSPHLSTDLAPAQQSMPLSFRSQSASASESYVRTYATPPTEMSDSDLSTRVFLANPTDVDTIYPGPSHNPFLRGGPAVPGSSAFAQGHQPFDQGRLSHSHPEPACSSQAAVTDMYGTMNDEDSVIDTTIADHGYIASTRNHNLANKRLDMDDNGMLTHPSDHRISIAPTSFRTQSAPSSVDYQAIGSQSATKRATSSNPLDDDSLETPAAEKLDAPTITPLRQAHLNTLLASLIPSAPSSPRDDKKRSKDGETEDSFDSGSEQEDDADIDFKSASKSPSVRSKSPTPVPTPPESDYEQSTKAKRPARQTGKADAPVKKPPRTSGFGDWPIASQARRRSVARTDSPVSNNQLPRSASDGAAHWPLNTEASRAADRGVAVSGIPTLTRAGHDHNTASPKLLRLPSQNHGKSGGEMEKRVGDQMLESEADADMEVQMSPGREEENESGVLVSTRKTTSLSQDIQKAPLDEEVRNGHGWTLMVEKGRNGERRMKWKLC